VSSTRSDATQSLPFPLTLPATTGTRLLVFHGSLPVPHKLPKRGEVVIGRGEVDIKIDDRSLSRKHARLHVTEDGDAFRVEDLGSTNGTRVRGERIAGPADVAAGELFHVGHVGCVVERVTEKRAGKRQSKTEQLRSLVDLVAASEISVFIHGETGSGKEVTARAIHAASARRDKPFVAFNCAALPENLLESELFGFERGAFSGADRVKPGLLESADGGTVLLDEIAEMAPGVQAKMLRVLEEREVQRLGALKPRAIDVRLISASHRLLDDEVEGGGFRQDLYFRINGITIELPPLRERLEELDEFARTFLAEAAKKAKRAPPTITQEAGRKMRAYSWPGNLRELKNAMERALVLCAGGPEIGGEHLSLTAPKAARKSAVVDEPGDERGRIVKALQDAAGNQHKAAELLGISRRTLINRLEQYNIPRPRKG
jgi:transcriptional regulator with PAS, ATPase and Fis domain